MRSKVTAAFYVIYALWSQTSAALRSLLNCDPTQLLQQYFSTVTFSSCTNLIQGVIVTQQWTPLDPTAANKCERDRQTEMYGRPRCSSLTLNDDGQLKTSTAKETFQLHGKKTVTRDVFLSLKQITYWLQRSSYSSPRKIQYRERNACFMWHPRVGEKVMQLLYGHKARSTDVDRKQKPGEYEV
jgi:hypothetical protein